MDLSLLNLRRFCVVLFCVQGTEKQQKQPIFYHLNNLFTA